MRKKLKIVVIGGGSIYTPELIEQLLSVEHNLPISELWLVDIDRGAKKLNIIAELARRMIVRSGKNIVLNITLDRRMALQEADFILTQFRAGCLEARIRDEHIAYRYGMTSQDNNGICKLTNALRAIPVILDICRDIEELCPDAWLLNYTSPCGMVTEAVMQYSCVKAIGLCNVPVLMHKGMAEMLLVSPDQLRVQIAGLNHLIWARHAWLDGQDRLSDLVEQVLSGDNLMMPPNVPSLTWPKSILRPMNMIPCASLQYYYMTDDIMKQEKEEAMNKGTRGEMAKAMEQHLLDLYCDPKLDHKPIELENSEGRFYAESACTLMSAIYHDSGELMHVNTYNNGTINGLPDDCVVEVTSMITRAGPLPLNNDPLPEDALNLLRQVKTFERLAIAAAIRGDLSLARRALMCNPLVTTGKIVEFAIDDILREGLEDLPSYWNSFLIWGEETSQV
ncbi:6-phospho-beta-glucosidase [Chromobacterium violaceum]|uniref:6-phospho-beta-glucosidase n=1 Tax=Chromobacterium violaceum TaxID=536 RepID=UPI0015F95FE4|nr:6-phospho-beta-glucosidase [Chromobacterium violaceum]MBA8737425.1 6-phospho-beta-glucosidase [Chromobacterium violaceum]